ncbi:nuclear transport factor 2 family protein [Streptomyces sp. TG1A-8]|uniref:nuclear transport factor 2 family protein n=1 Tax=Streptomyces sp. TG1A-8 TaxID=3051385 RepID=UPI00265BD6A4|nr:nuclear transport factor 2 family protein [Streptomyces sp. TG1A-8]MDO0924177.1 nuclear transport factor 2 family protein [Streptomyces sp. TG1A-8]
MTATPRDRRDIADLMTGWVRRDLGEWGRLRELFHPDGRIEITWFEGPAAGFVDASTRAGASDFRTKHLITAPVVPGPRPPDHHRPRRPGRHRARTGPGRNRPGTAAQDVVTATAAPLRIPEPAGPPG